MRGSPLPEVAETFADTKPRHAILFIVDGCRADTLYNALDDGKMPRLKTLMESVGYRRYEKCFTVFPSVTIACHASLVTGSYPGWHGIVGNNWFIRKKWAPDNHGRKFYEATREYVKLSWWHPGSDPGLVNGFMAGTFFSIANSDLYARASTIYEAHDQSSDSPSASVFEVVWRGANRRTFIDQDDIGALLRGVLYDALNWIYSKITGRPLISFGKKSLDRKSFQELDKMLDVRESKRPGLFVVWVPGMDPFSHKNSSLLQPEYFKKRSRWVEKLLGSIDRQFGRLHDALRERGLLEDTLIAVTADHGQYPCDSRNTISMTEMYRYLQADPEVSPGETFPLDDDGEIDDNCEDATVAISQNGGSCHIYVRSNNGWGEAPSPNRLKKFARAFDALGCADKILVRHGMTGYKLYEDDEYRELSTLDPEEYPLAEERVNSLAATLRTGDIMLSAKSPWYYEGKPMKGEHGSLHREDSHVPLIF
ncbi:alkaline phosphatase family protein, partial [Planctomycetota bacterium]